MKRRLSARGHHFVARAGIFLIAVALTAGMVGCGPYFLPSKDLEVRTWYDLDAVRNNLEGHHRLMNDLDSATPGYAELAGPTANGGQGWEAIGVFVDTHGFHGFIGSFDGQGYEIHDLFINRPEPRWGHIGLFGALELGGIIENLGMVNVSVIGDTKVGGLVGGNGGAVRNCYSSGTVSGEAYVGGLVGWASGTVSSSHSTCNVTGDHNVGGLVGSNAGAIQNCYSTGSATGNQWNVGGLVGDNGGSVCDSYSRGSVSGSSFVGGLVGTYDEESSASNSYYSYDEVLINGESIVTIGALPGDDLEEWLACDKFLDVNETLCKEDGYYLINDVNDFKSLLSFGQNASLKFRLTRDLDLGHEPNFIIPYFAGEFDGNGREIANLSFNFGFVSHVGLFGCVAAGAKVARVGVENVNITGDRYVGALVGKNHGTVSESYSSGAVTGNVSVGGLMGENHGAGTVNSSYSTSTVTGNGAVGGLVGANLHGGTVSHSYSRGSVSGYEGVGGLVGCNWYSTVSNSYSTGSVSGSENIGGLIGDNYEAVAGNCYWNAETSGQVTSAGGMDKTTAEMQDMTTFSGAAWNIVAVANSGMRNPSYIWNIVDGQTYPFLSWQA